MVCFIILHYIVEDETYNCVENLRSIDGEKKIIIVDNASPNGSGKRIEEKYLCDPDIDVIINTDNLGFANGNNVGCRYAKNRYNPDYYIVMNNDIEITQKDFIRRIYNINEKKDFDILGPDIFSTTYGFHQSPKSLTRTSLKKARKLQKIYKKKLNSKIVVPLRCYVKQINILRKLYNKKLLKKNKIDYTQEYENVPLHGACFIFTKKFMYRRKNAFFDGTFFYYESEILDYECQLNGLKEVYDSSLFVKHHQNVSTNTMYADVLRRTRFMNEQNYNSITAFLEKYDYENK